MEKKVYHNILELIGNTPILNISSLYPLALEKKISVYCKLERFNPGGSIKDRIALSMIEDAFDRGIIDEQTHIIEPTSGNTGIGLAMICASKKLKLSLVMPESMSIERRKILKAYGASLELTPKEKGMKGAIERAFELQKQIQNSWIPSQFENPSNPKVHQEQTAKEIMDVLPHLDALITGVGTGGHITGMGQALRKKFPEMDIFAVEPSDSPVISGGTPGPHFLQGIGAGFIPKNLDTSLLTGVITIEKQEAFAMASKAAMELGLLCGISTGASLSAVQKKLQSLKEGSHVLTMNYDTGERYLSVEGLF